MLSAKQGHYWYHFYNVFGMTRFLTGDWTRDLPHSKLALYHKAIEEAVLAGLTVVCFLILSTAVYSYIPKQPEHYFILIHFSLIVKQAYFAQLNRAWIRSWTQPVLSNEGEVSCSRKQQELLMGLEFTTDRHPSITSKTRYPLHHAPPL